MTETILTIVVPCYNEEEMLAYTMAELGRLLEDLETEGLISSSSKLLFVDDGSRDRTWNLIHKESLKSERVTGLKLSRNSGHQNALLAGIFTSMKSSDCIVTIDADLQDDPGAIREFLIKYHEGCDIVYGVRSKREEDSFFKRATAQGFYKMMAKLGASLVYNHADFRLLSRRAAEELAQYGETNMFLRGIIPLIGFRSAQVLYERKERMAGETKYPLKKMISFALDGLTSFSVTPIRLVLMAGIVSSVISVLFGTYFLFLKFTGSTEAGWTSLISSIWLIGGVQLTAIGMIGEYIGKIYKETKRRPRFIVEIDTYTLPASLQLKNREMEQDEGYSIKYRQLPETN